MYFRLSVCTVQPIELAALFLSCTAPTPPEPEKQCTTSPPKKFFVLSMLSSLYLSVTQFVPSVWFMIENQLLQCARIAFSMKSEIFSQLTYFMQLR